MLLQLGPNLIALAWSNTRMISSFPTLSISATACLAPLQVLDIFSVDLHTIFFFFWDKIEKRNMVGQVRLSCFFMKPQSMSLNTRSLGSTISIEQIVLDNKLGEVLKSAWPKSIPLLARQFSST